MLAAGALHLLVKMADLTIGCLLHVCYLTHILHGWAAARTVQGAITVREGFKCFDSPSSLGARWRRV